MSLIPPKMPIGGPYSNRNSMVPGGTAPSARSSYFKELSKQALVQVNEWGEKAYRFAQLIQDFQYLSIETDLVEVAFNAFRRQHDPDIFDHHVYKSIALALTGAADRADGKKIVDRGFSLFFLMKDRQGRYLPDL